MSKSLKFFLISLFVIIYCIPIFAQVKLPNVVKAVPSNSASNLPTSALKNSNQFTIAGSEFSFKEDNIKLIVLLHGITSNTLETGPPTSTYYDEDVSVNTIKHVKAYFGYQFIVKLMGYNGNVSENPTILNNSTSLPKITNLAGDRMDNARDFYRTSNTRNNMDHLIYNAEGRNDLYVLLSPRNGAISAMDQAKAALDNIDSAYKHLENKLKARSINLQNKKHISMYFVCHSGGGIVTRIIMKPNIIFENKTLNETKASFVRDRIANVTTIATPHDGSPLPSKVNSIIESAGIADDFISSTFSYSPYLQNVFNANNPLSIESLVRCLPSMEDRASRDNMANEFILNFNRLQGDPKYGRRSDSSLIPIHCLGGRRPTGPYYNSLSQDFLGGMPNYYISNTSNVIEIKDRIMGMYVAGIPPVHFLLHKLNVPFVNDTKNWGAPSGVAQIQIFDKVKWGVKNSVTGLFQPYVFTNETTNLPTSIVYCLPGTDGEIDSDGFVSIKSAVGYNLGTTVSNYFDHTKGGSFYRFYTGPFEEHNHGTITRSQQVSQYIMDEIVKKAGPYVGTAGEVSSWVKPL
jgi:hypothetical protein